MPGRRTVRSDRWFDKPQGTRKAGTTKVVVVTQADDSRVVAYCAWCMAQLSATSAPSRLRKGAGRYPQPMALLARLGVDTALEGRGLGAALLQDVFARLLELSDNIGCRGLLVHAESDEAGTFYLQCSPDRGRGIAGKG